MKKYSKLLSILLAIVILTVMSASCTTTQKNDVQSTGTTAAGQVERLSVSMTVKAQYATPDDAKYLKIMEDKYNLDIDLWDCFGEQYANQVNARIASGTIPDIISMSGLDLNEYIRQGVVIEMPDTDIIQYMPKYHADLLTLTQTPFKYSKINGVNYGVPYTTADGIYHFTIIWRDDWLKNIGIDKVPETLDECEDAFYKFTKDDPDQNSTDDTYGLSNLGMLPIFGAFGPIPYNNSPENLSLYKALKGDEIVFAATQPEMKEALLLLNKWYKDGIIDPEFVTGERKEGHWSATQAFSSGRIGYTSAGQYYNTGKTDEIGRDGRIYKMFKDTQTALGFPDTTYTHGRPPIGPDGNSGTIKWGVEGGVSFAFGKPLENDKEKQKKIFAWWDEMWTDQDNYMEVIYGIKDEDWTQDPVTGVVNIGLGPDTKDAFAKDEIPTIGLGYQFMPDMANRMKQETPKYYEFADKVADYSGAGYVDPMGSATLETNTMYAADLVKITLIAYVDMITGKKPIDTYFDQYVKEMEAAGMTELLEEANEWWKVSQSN